MAMNLRPFLSFNASNMRCAGAVKSVAVCGANYVCTMVAPHLAFFSASSNAATPSLPNA